jgi:hypothetical protein
MSDHDWESEFLSEVIDYIPEIANKWNFIGIKLKQGNLVSQIEHREKRDSDKLTSIIQAWLEGANRPQDELKAWETIVDVLDSPSICHGAMARKIEKKKLTPRQVVQQGMEQDGNEQDGRLSPSATGSETDSVEDYGSRLEADYGQNEGQRCIPVGVLMQFCRGVLRMRIQRSDGKYGHASGFFVELNSSHWIITTCHTLLNKDDGELMKEGKHDDIDDLLGKMMTHLRSCTFFLPNEQFELAQLEKPLDAIVPDIRHLVEDPVSVFLLTVNMYTH